MSVTYLHASQYLQELLAGRSADELLERIRPKAGKQLPAVPGGAVISPKVVARRWKTLQSTPEAQSQLFDVQTSSQMERYAHNIEHFIGTVKVPVGVAGPLRVNGLFAQGEYYVPLATTEAALVASYSRGAALITKAGGASAVLLNEGVSRSPVFAFENFEQVGRFLRWVLGCIEEIKRVAESTTRHGKLMDVQVMVEGNHLYCQLIYSPGDAAGQNLVTIATEAVVDWILKHSPVTPRASYVEANFSGDKKASVQSLQTVRGRKVTAEVTIPSDLVERFLRTSCSQMVNYSRMATMGGILSGTLGSQGHYANGLAALFIACGQDAACVSEASVGATRFELTENGGLYASVTLPNLIVGTVGGGTHLPSQQACLGILHLAGAGHARAFAEVAACLCLAGEISVVGAMCAGEFTRAHARLARGRR
jgi:hydroxymethylglutaryl-CoA reductase (NADPH)